MQELTDFDEALLRSMLEPMLMQVTSHPIYAAIQKVNEPTGSFLEGNLSDYTTVLALLCWKAGFIEGARKTRFL